MHGRKYRRHYLRSSSSPIPVRKKTSDENHGMLYAQVPMVTHTHQVIIVVLLELDKAPMYRKERRKGGGNMEIMREKGTD